MAAEFLNVPEVVDVEDWGCGMGHFRPYLAAHQRWIGVDGSEWSQATKIVDLTNYQSAVDGIHMRGVIEHNLEWQAILEAAMDSFTKRAVLTVYEPFVDEYSIIRTGQWIVQRFTRVQIEAVIPVSGGDPEFFQSSQVRTAARPKGLPGEETLYCLTR